MPKVLLMKWMNTSVRWQSYSDSQSQKASFLGLEAHSLGKIGERFFLGHFVAKKITQLS